MPRYKNISEVTQRFRAGEAGKKKVYAVESGEVVDVPVKISAQCMILVEEDMKRKPTKKEKGE